MRALLESETLSEYERLLIEMLQWARERERHAEEVYGKGTERTPAIYAAFIHNAFCLVDNHVGSRMLTALQESYYALTGFRFAAETHVAGAGRQLRMSAACHSEVRQRYEVLTTLLFDEPLRRQVLHVLLSTYQDRLTYDSLQASPSTRRLPASRGSAGGTPRLCTTGPEALSQ